MKPKYRRSNEKKFVPSASLARSKRDQVHVEKASRIARSWKPECSKELQLQAAIQHNQLAQGGFLSIFGADVSFQFGRSYDHEH